VPVAIIALILIWRSHPDDTKHPAGLDYRGTALITGAMALLVLGLQQSSTWGWGSPATWACIVLGGLLGVAFVAWERRASEPLLQLGIFSDQGFSAETAVLLLMNIVFVPFFFFASIYSQVSLGKNASNAGFYIMYFFIGFVIAAQIGGRILDQRGARPAVVLGAALGAVGFFLLAGKVTDLSISKQWFYIALAGAGPGLMLGVASTDAVNRAPSSGYSEVTGITQTARNFGGSLGLAVLGAVLISRDKVNVTSALTKAGVPGAQADKIATQFGSGAGSSSGHPHALVHSVQLAFAHSTQTVFYIMAGVMAATFLVALRWVPPGRVQAPEETLEAKPEPAGVQ
jgi:Major Facilitator Superfamily